MREPEAFRRGCEAFDAGRFFEAHEHWEAVWKASPSEARPYYRAMIQLAASCLKIARQEYAPARQLLLRAVKGLAEAPSVPPGGVADLRSQALETLERLEALGAERLAEFDPRWFPRLARDS